MTLEDIPTRVVDASCTDAATHRLKTGLYILPHGDDEVFVRDGSRAAFSKIVKDPKRRRLLSRVVQAATDPICIGSLAEAWTEDPDALSEIVDQLTDAGVLVPIETQTQTITVRLLGEGVVADTLAGFAHGDDRFEVVTYGSLPDLQAFLDDHESGPEPDTSVIAVCTDALDPALCLDANAVAIQYAIPIVFAHVDGVEAVIGPFVIPGETACYLCHDLQDEGARHLRDEYLVYKDSLRRGVPGPGADPAVAALAAAWLRLALAQRDPHVRGFLDQRVLRIESSRMEVMSHRILTIPRCPACSSTRADLEHTFL